MCASGESPIKASSKSRWTSRKSRSELLRRHEDKGWPARGSVGCTRKRHTRAGCTLIERFARATFQQAWLSHVLEPLSARLRRYARLAEDVVPHGIHRFDRRSWVIKETAFGVRLWCSLDERAISRPILLDRYEPAETRFIERTLRPGDFAVDAGANIGYHALHLAQL